LIAWKTLSTERGSTPNFFAIGKALARRSESDPAITIGRSESHSVEQRERWAMKRQLWWILIVAPLLLSAQTTSSSIEGMLTEYRTGGPIGKPRSIFNRCRTPRFAILLPPPPMAHSYFET
jgi:hypothetical protein